MDRRNNKLIFIVHFLEMEERILVDFRLSKVSKLVLCYHLWLINYIYLTMMILI